MPRGEGREEAAVLALDALGDGLLDVGRETGGIEGFDEDRGEDCEDREGEVAGRG